MTAPTEEARGVAAIQPDPEVPADLLLDLGEPRASATGADRSRWWRIGFPVALVLLIACVPVLVYAGVHVVLQSNNGRLIAASTDPAQPGWEAAIEPTPVAVLATVTDQGQLSSATVVALTSDGSGSAIFVPAYTQIPNLPNYQTMVDAYAAGGASALKSGLEVVLGVDVGQVTVANRANWDELVAPVGTVTIANPDSVEVNGVLLPRGSVDLTPAQVGPYLLAGNWAEDDTNRLLRQEAFWHAWLTKVATAGTADAVPGESDSGIGRFVRTLAGDQVAYSVLPVKVLSRPDVFGSVFVPLSGEVASVVAKAIPFPAASPPGSRPRVRVLDGTGQLEHGVPAAMSMAANGAQIDAIGNAATFDVATTQFIINDEAQRARADQLRAALGVGEIVMTADVSDSVDITLILGADARNLPSTQGGGVGPVSTSTTASVATTATTAPASTTSSTLTSKSGRIGG
jgi:hypothetical protein